MCIRDSRRPLPLLAVALSAAQAQLSAGLAQLDGVLAKLESGIIPGGIIEGVDEDTSIEDARAALSSARSQALSAVSYTHLDVYKRQSLARRSARARRT